MQRHFKACLLPSVTCTISIAYAYSLSEAKRWELATSDWPGQEQGPPHSPWFPGQLPG